MLFNIMQNSLQKPRTYSRVLFRDVKWAPRQSSQL